jgi:hypothetical protein
MSPSDVLEAITEFNSDVNWVANNSVVPFRWEAYLGLSGKLVGMYVRGGDADALFAEAARWESHAIAVGTWVEDMQWNKLQAMKRSSVWFDQDAADYYEMEFNDLVTSARGIESISRAIGDALSVAKNDTDQWYDGIWKATRKSLVSIAGVIAAIATFETLVVFVVSLGIAIDAALDAIDIVEDLENLVYPKFEPLGSWPQPRFA